MLMVRIIVSVFASVLLAASCGGSEDSIPSGDADAGAEVPPSEPVGASQQEFSVKPKPEQDDSQPKVPTVSEPEQLIEDTDTIPEVDEPAITEPVTTVELEPIDATMSSFGITAAPFTFPAEATHIDATLSWEGSAPPGSSLTITGPDNFSHTTTNITSGETTVRAALKSPLGPFRAVVNYNGKQYPLLLPGRIIDRDEYYFMYPPPTGFFHVLRSAGPGDGRPVVSITAEGFLTGAQIFVDMEEIPDATAEWPAGISDGYRHDIILGNSDKSLHTASEFRSITITVTGPAGESVTTIESAHPTQLLTFADIFGRGYYIPHTYP